MIRSPRPPRYPFALRRDHVLADGLVGAFVAGPGGMVDLTGNSHPVRVSPNQDVRRGWIARRGVEAVDFTGDATLDRISLGTIQPAHPLSLAGVTEATVLIDCRLDGYAGFRRAVDKSSGGFTASGWGVYVGYSGSDGIWVWSTSGASGGQLHRTLSAPMAPGETALMGVSMTSLSAGQWYRDGDAVSSMAGTLPAIAAVATGMSIGNWNHSATAQRQWDGALYSVRIYSGRALTAEEHALAADPAERHGWIEEYGRRLISIPAVAAGTTKTVTDTATGTDAIGAIVVALSLADSGTGADALPGTAASAAVPDTGVGTDALGLAAALGLSDTGVGSDSIAAIAAALSVADTASAVEAITGITVALSIGDTGTGTDAPAIAAALSVADTASGADAVSVVTEILKTVADSATGTDAVSVTVQATIADTATGTDVIAALAALVALADSGSGVDVVARFDASVQLATLTFTLRQRAAVFTLASRSAAFSMAARSMTFSLAA